MEYLLTSTTLHQLLNDAEQHILTSPKFKFERLLAWRKQTVPDHPGVYVLFEKTADAYSLIYVGETGNLRERMNDICRTVNHTFRRQLGHKRFAQPKPKKQKFNSETESALDAFMDEYLYVSFLEVNFGRTEIETYLVTKYQNQLLNSETKRKLKIELDKLD